MRESTGTYSRTASEPVSPTKILTTYSNKVISIELKNNSELNVIHCSFKNGLNPPKAAILEKAVNGYDFKEIAVVKDCNLELFTFEDENKNFGERCNYRFLIRQRNGVTYYSEILSYVN